jgi:hypothetical protein
VEELEREELLFHLLLDREPRHDRIVVARPRRRFEELGVDVDDVELGAGAAGERLRHEDIVERLGVSFEVEGVAVAQRQGLHQAG